MILHEGWFSSNESIPDYIIDSYLNDYLVYNYMRIYNLMPKEQEANYKRLLKTLYTLKSFKNLDAKINQFVTSEAKNQPKENAINTMNRIAKGFGVSDKVMDNAIKDFKKNELGEFVYEEATIERNPYEPGTIKANTWRPGNENIVNEDEDEDEDWMQLWKNSKQITTESAPYIKLKNILAENKRNKDESYVAYIKRIQSLFNS